MGSGYGRDQEYDSRSGPCTQLDPIGLAGGMNSYGFAAGDPINFSAPFWLRPDSLSTEEAEECQKKEAAEAKAEAEAAAALHARCMAAQRTLVTAAAGDASVLIGARAIQGASKALSTATRHAGTSANAAGFANGVCATGATGAGGASGVAAGSAANGLSGDSWYHWVPGLVVASRAVDQIIACSDKYQVP
jgi:hypothetical protein